MKIIEVVTLFARGEFAVSREWQDIRAGLHASVLAADWPPGSGTFTIFPEAGNKSGMGNGVRPIKNECMSHLVALGWKREQPLGMKGLFKTGSLDAVFYSSRGPIAMEWESGNISSSHRALNKMAIGLLKGVLVGATLVVPSAALAKYLTDRIGNIRELRPYLELLSALQCDNGVFEIVVIEHDAESFDVPKIPKGNDGNAHRKRKRSSSRPRKRKPGEG